MDPFLSMMYFKILKMLLQINFFTLNQGYSMGAGIVRGSVGVDFRN